MGAWTCHVLAATCGLHRPQGQLFNSDIRFFGTESWGLPVTTERFSCEFGELLANTTRPTRSASCRSTGPRSIFQSWISSSVLTRPNLDHLWHASNSKYARSTDAKSLRCGVANSTSDFLRWTPILTGPKHMNHETNLRHEINQWPTRRFQL